MTGSSRCFKLVNRGVNTVPMQYAGEGEATKASADNSNMLFQEGVFLSVMNDLSLFCQA